MDEFMLLPFVEIEIRFGTCVKVDKFDSCIDKKYFYEIKERLDNTKDAFNMVELKNTIEYIDKNKLKLIEHNKNRKLIMKENVITKTLKMDSSPFDIRLSVNQEFNLQSYINSFSKTDTTIRQKARTSYITNDYRYDLTVVSQTINNVKKEKYEIEIEILVNKETLTWSKEYINDFIECKIYDIVNIVEPIECDTFKIKF